MGIYAAKKRKERPNWVTRLRILEGTRIYFGTPVKLFNTGKFVGKFCLPDFCRCSEGKK